LLAAASTCSRLETLATWVVCWSGTASPVVFEEPALDVRWVPLVEEGVRTLPVL
jgi:hypothetical protein